MRDRAAILTAQIARSLPNLTIHDITHLDALWEIADVIAGPNYQITPLEAFIFGGAVLLHDAALSFEAYEGGKAYIRSTVQWKDALAAIAQRSNPPQDNPEDAADFVAMRSLHALRAGELAAERWITPEGEELYLIEHSDLRRQFGKLIGDIAASHHWPIEDLISKLPSQINAPPYLPREWRVDPVKVGCLLRCADAAHIDSRRAPDFLRALVHRTGLSAHHWTAQNWLQRVDIDASDPTGRSLLFTSARPFDQDHAAEWWVAYDATCLVDRELSSCADLLARRPQAAASPPFKMTQVSGARSPESASRSITVIGWSPKSVEIHVSNLERLVTELGGERLYGERQKEVVVLRELIQNARDAILARRSVDPEYIGRIKVAVDAVDGGYNLSIADDGVGMSYRVATGSLLDFGTSFWASDMVRTEFPGLLASGYRSVGKFGIGFYSAFMIASSLSVATRRFDSGLSEVTQIIFPTGLSLRPLVRQGPPAGFGSLNNTIVMVTLQAQYGDASDIIINPGRPDYEPEVRLPLEQCLRILCCGLDAIVELRTGAAASRIIHEPLEHLVTQTSRAEWLAQITGENMPATVKEALHQHGARLRPIRDGLRVVGMAALSLVRFQQRNCLGNVATVGGLATSIAESDLSRYIGVIDYGPGSAKREPSGQPTGGIQVLETWANEQKSLLPERTSDPISWCYASCSLADLQLDPFDVFSICIATRSTTQIFDLHQAIDVIVEQGLAIYQSAIMKHVETHHKQGSFHIYPTLVPVSNSAFYSLSRDACQNAPITSFLSCIDRLACQRGIAIKETFLPNVSTSSFGPMHVVLLTQEKPPVDISLSTSFQYQL